MTVLWTIAWPLIALSALGIWFWGAVWFRLGRWLARDPSVRRGLDLDPPAGGWPTVSIVVPVEIVFVLDRCTDRTAELLAAHARADDRVRIVTTGGRPPAGWTGKCHAARHGASHATGEWLLFADADTRFDPELVRAAVALAAHRDVGLLSVLSTLTTGRRFERLAQPVASMYLMRLYPITRVDRGDRSRPFANGQFLLFRRDWYTRIGGHEAVRDRLLEDIALARRVHHHGGRTAVLLADGMLRCSMYGSWDAFRSGWKRIFIEACKRKPGRLRKNAVRVLAAGVVLPAVQVATLLVAAGLARDGDAPLATSLAAVVLGGIVVQGSALARVYRLSGAPLGAAAGFCLGSWLVARIMLEGARDLRARAEVRWGGISYALEPR
jgi:GT2 family glycosyltransferase